MSNLGLGKIEGVSPPDLLKDALSGSSPLWIGIQGRSAGISSREEIKETSRVEDTVGKTCRA